MHVPVGSNITPVAAVAARGARAPRHRRRARRLALRPAPPQPRDRSRTGGGRRDRAAARRRGPCSGLQPRRRSATLSVPAGVAARRPGRLERTRAVGAAARQRPRAAALRRGLSTRRTTLMAALAHGSPVAGCAAAQRDERAAGTTRDALLLTPAARRRGLRPGRRRARRRSARGCGRMGSAGRRLYEQRFDWPVLADAVTSALRLPRAAS